MTEETTLKAEVRATTLETRSGIKAKKGDVIEIPADESKQTGAIRHALRSGNLKVIKAETDLGPVTSEPAAPPQKAGEVRRLDDPKHTGSKSGKKKEDRKTSDEE